MLLNPIYILTNFFIKPAFELCLLFVLISLPCISLSSPITFGKNNKAVHQKS